MSDVKVCTSVYRLAKRNGELVLQVLWIGTFDKSREWRDTETVDLDDSQEVKLDINVYDSEGNKHE